jgi:ABC-type phosphate transport system auxiliary subunit
MYSCGLVCGVVQSYLEKILRLADERSEMEGRFSEAQRAHRAAETMQNRLEQVHQKHCLLKTNVRIATLFIVLHIYIERRCSERVV